MRIVRIKNIRNEYYTKECETVIGVPNRIESIKKDILIQELINQGVDYSDSLELGLTEQHSTELNENIIQNREETIISILLNLG
ncbi:hypothetical protein [Ulvibacter litoralis]|uniref:Uncharacterized protein n=1 Tax=Ulvibacter litoralis TaxID=227084 RepID=A0A1G7HGJ2_9FLAO|nr:hypothetical protein [Ulvibacter litoralis]GHC57721.1 hypothetical protein GCM10008083_22910 [Ulvibacter litoralis]SDE99471.1 hypothetical protein SAMN05421855_10479 [Ulvibacter litoralis]